MAEDGLPLKRGNAQSCAREIWKPVPSEPGVLASNLGRILQAPGYAPLPNGGYRTYLPQPRYGVVAKASKSATHVYRHIMLRRYGPGPRQQPRKVHQLVCEAFHGPKPFPEAVVIHLDEDALNNRPENLKWGTQKENLNMPKFKAWCSGEARRRALPKGERHHASKLTEAQVHFIRSSTECGTQLARRFGVTSSAIYSIRNDKTWKAA